MKRTNVGKTERLISMGAAGLLLGSAIKAKPLIGGVMVATAGVLIRRALTGHCNAYEALGVNTRLNKGRALIAYEAGVPIEASVTIERPREEVFRMWRNLENLPHFMRNIESVRNLEGKKSHWIIKGPGGKNFEWDAEINNEIENELIAWRTLPHSDVASAGSVHFRDVGGSKATEVLVKMQYDPPGGKLGAGIAKLVGHDPAKMLQSDLSRLRTVAG